MARFGEERNGNFLGAARPGRTPVSPLSRLAGEGAGVRVAEAQRDNAVSMLGRRRHPHPNPLPPRRERELRALRSRRVLTSQLKVSI